MELNEGLEKLGESTFSWSAIETIKLPSTLKRIEVETFRSCNNLKSIEIPNGVEHIGRECFCYSRIKEITLPCTLREIGYDALNRCFRLNTVWVEEGCTLDIRAHAISSAIILSTRTMVGDKPLRDLRRQKDVVIPEGVTHIGER